MRAAIVAGLVALAGPLIGGLVLLALVVVPALVREGTGGMASFEMVSSLLLFVGVFSYVFGWLPALLGGAWLGWRTWVDGGFGYGQAALVAAIASGIGILLLMILSGQRDAGILGVAVFLMPLGGASGLVCRWLLGRLGVIAVPSRALRKS